jgi:hypothetical protein
MLVLLSRKRSRLVDAEKIVKCDLTEFEHRRTEIETSWETKWGMRLKVERFHKILASIDTGCLTVELLKTVVDYMQA